MFKKVVLKREEAIARWKRAISGVEGAAMDLAALREERGDKVGWNTDLEEAYQARSSSALSRRNIERGLLPLVASPEEVTEFSAWRARVPYADLPAWVYSRWSSVASGHPAPEGALEEMEFEEWVADEPPAPPSKEAVKAQKRAFADAQRVALGDLGFTASAVDRVIAAAGPGLAVAAAQAALGAPSPDAALLLAGGVLRINEKAKMWPGTGRICESLEACGLQVPEVLGGIPALLRFARGIRAAAFALLQGGGPEAQVEVWERELSRRAGRSPVVARAVAHEPPVEGTEVRRR